MNEGTAFWDTTPCILIDRYSSPVKMEEAGFSGAFLTVYQTPRRRTPEDSIVNGLLDD